MLMTLQCHFVSEYNIDNFLGSSINETYPLGRARGFVQKSYGRNRQSVLRYMVGLWSISCMSVSGMDGRMKGQSKSS